MSDCRAGAECPEAEAENEKRKVLLVRPIDVKKLINYVDDEGKSCWRMPHPHEDRVRD